MVGDAARRIYAQAPEVEISKWFDRSDGAKQMCMFPALLHRNVLGLQPCHQEEGERNSEVEFQNCGVMCLILVRKAPRNKHDLGVYRSVGFPPVENTDIASNRPRLYPLFRSISLSLCCALDIRFFTSTFIHTSHTLSIPLVKPQRLSK